MSTDSKSFSKGACTACGGHIEFPSEALGFVVACPHCGKETKMLANLPPVLKQEAASTGEPSAPEKFSTECPGCGLAVSVKAEACPSCGAVIRERSRLSWQLVVLSILAIAMLGGGAFAWQRGGQWKMPKVKMPEFKSPNKSPNPPPETESAAPTPPPPPTKVIKRTGEFKVLDHRIERVPGRSLVYVVGNATNDTDKQQFSVRVTFELTDRSGKSAGTATDYASVIEPGGGWQFRALVLETNVAKATLMTLETDKQ